MATPVEPLAAVTAAALLVALISILRARDADWPRIRWLVAALVAISGATLMMVIAEAVDLPERTAPLRTALFLSSGLLLMAFRHSFVRFHRAWWLVAGAASVAAALTVAVTGPTVGMADGMTPAQVGTALVWAAITLGTALSFWRLGSGRSPTQRARMRLLAGAIAALAISIGAVSASSVGREIQAGSPPAMAGMLFGVALLGLAIQPPAWLRRLQGGAQREQLRADTTRRISLATGRTELAHAAVTAAVDLLGADGAFLTDSGQVLASVGITASDAARIEAWSAGEAMERSVRVDDGPPILVTTRRASSSATLAVVAGPFSPVFGSDEGAQLEELAATVGLALTRVQLFEDLRHETERSEQLLAAVSDLGEGVFVTDGERLVEVNDAMCRMLGMTRSELLRLPSIMELFPTEHHEAGRARQERVTANLGVGEVAEQFEATLVRPDRRQLRTTIALRAIDTIDGPRIIGAIRDVTASHRALRDQQRRAQHLAALRQLESTVAGLLDLDALIDAITEAVSDLFQSRVAAVALFDGPGGDPLVKHRGLDDQQADDLRSAVTVAGAATGALRLRRDEVDLHALPLSAGHPLLTRSVGVPIASGDRALGFLLVGDRTRRDAAFDEVERSTLRDLASYIGEITQTVRAYESERAVADELRRVDETRDLLLSAVSHDLRSPLSTIATMARTLEMRGESLDGEFRVEMARRIYGQATRLGRIVTDLLDLDRLRRGMLEAERRPVALGDLIHSSLAVVDRRALERIATDIDDVVVAVDGPKVERLVENLVLNAIHHGGETSRIWIQAHETGGAIRIVVEDDGPGVEPAARERIFHAFERDGDHGFGLGLALVRRIAELHGGSATVEDRPGGGARFVVTLRHQRPDPVIDVTTDEEPATHEPEPVDPETRRAGPGGPARR